MTVNSRREFFKRFLPLASQAEGTPVQGKIEIGALYEFPLNSKTLHQSGHLELWVESLQEGLRVCDKSQTRYFALAIAKNGKLLVDLENHWEKFAVMSVLTGEATHI
jgi:hypothetical protein